MCGIVGFWDFKGRTSKNDLEKIIQSMSDQLSHRGPDSDGFWVDEAQGLALGHRRLSILDLSSTGRQPMSSHKQWSALTYNGEVYNFQDLKMKLQQSGTHFKSTSDTEVILEAAEKWGIDETLENLIGMFAFAFLDKKYQTLHLARDPLGIKPLYWGIFDHTLIFASEIKSFFHHPAFKPSLNHDILGSYFKLGYIPAPASIYHGVYKLLPGHRITFDQNGRIDQKCYWSVDRFVTKKTIYETDHKNLYVDEFHDLLKDAIHRQMIADVPLGAFLSGGIDSSCVVAIMQALSNRPIKTFSIGFNDQTFNEAPFAKAVAQHLKTDHTELYLGEDDAMAFVPELPHFYDEPFADSSQIPTMMVSKLAANHVKVVLSGDGGDELLAGYSRYLFADKWWKRLNRIPFPIRELSGKLWGTLPNNVLQKIAYSTKNQSLRSLLLRNQFVQQILGSKRIENLYENIVSTWPDPTLLSVKASPLSFKNKFNLDPVSYMQWQDIHTYLPDDILCKVDRASMAFSLESRVPLLDHRLMEFVWQLPDSYKIRQGQSKWILRKVLERYVPPALTDRPKMGFGIPIDHWLKGALKSWASDLLTPSKCIHYNLNPDPIQRMWQAHQEGQGRFGSMLWNVLSYIAWRDHWKV